jgi:glycosyltransferase involved in cell wall biosynthesis
VHNIGIRNQFLVDALYRLFVHGIYNRCDYVACPSQFARRQLRRHGLRTPFAVVSNGVPAEYRPRPHSRRDGKFVILSVGRLAPE